MRGAADRTLSGTAERENFRDGGGAPPSSSEGVSGLEAPFWSFSSQTSVHLVLMERIKGGEEELWGGGATDGPRVEHTMALPRLAVPRACTRLSLEDECISRRVLGHVRVCPCTCPCSGAEPVFTWGSFWSVPPPVIPPFFSRHTSACHLPLY